MYAPLVVLSFAFRCSELFSRCVRVLVDRRTSAQFRPRRRLRRVQLRAAQLCLGPATSGHQQLPVWDLLGQLSLASLRGRLIEYQLRLE